MNPNDQIASAVTATVNLMAEGKQHGFLTLPHSSNTSAWGSVRIPVTVINHGQGPTVTMIGGSHGDEYEGPITLMRLANELSPAQIQGRLILIPCLNMPAVAAATRLSPIDQLNMNRVFPGTPDGAITERIADFITRHIVDISDVVLDLHAGGKTLNFIPLAAVHFLADRALQHKAEELMIAFGAPNSLRMRELDDRGMLDTTVENQGRIFVTTELGGGGTATRQSLEITYTGCRNVLRQSGLLDEPLTLRATRMLEMPDDECFIAAGDAGMLAMHAELGQDVYRGDTLAEIYPVDRTGTEPVTYRASRNGVLLARHHPGLINPGDCLAVIAEEVQR
ncbi:MAG: N(2)-acetyl-L-2,4-diaminobutanoate deacetylase DoeB [Gammaproteobacteria bacterium]|nr:N(2)-acetyl-L-2,4-diaminobutanoate deacetylase DoeB [Gammaproteobacteria bacterium]